MKDTLVIIFSIVVLILSGQLSISLPDSISTVPVTAQTLAVLTVAYVSDSSKGCLIVFLYVLLGAIGFPVFSNWSGGIEIFTGKSGGFLVGFMVAAVIIYLLRKQQQDSIARIIALHLIGTFLILFFGFSWLIHFLGLEAAFTKGVVPYLPGAFFKIIIGGILSFYLMKWMQKVKS